LERKGQERTGKEGIGIGRREQGTGDIKRRDKKRRDK